MENSRTKNTIYNTLYGVVSSFSMIFLNFLVRYFLVKELGEEIYGIHSFFQNVTNVLLLLELGLSTAVIIHLYEPVNNKDYNSIREILSFYRKIYNILAVVFFILCFVYGLFILPYNITTTVDRLHLTIFFLIFSLSFSVNYLTYHKRSLLFADQKNRISTLNTMICEIIFRGLQILILITIHSYIIFLILLILEKFSANFLCINYINKHYPELGSYSDVDISKEKRDKILSTMRPLFVNQISGTLQNAAPGFIIGLLLGNVSIVGYYANYQLLISSILLLYSQIGGAFTTSYGNLSVENNLIHMQNAYEKTSFLTNGLAMIICAVFLSSVQDFISIIFGANFLLSWNSLVILSMSMIVTIFNVPIISVQNAMGLHRVDYVYMVLQALISISLAYILCYYYGMEGLFIGSLIPSVFFTLILKGYLITRKVFKWNLSKYLVFITRDLIKLLIVLILVLIITLNIDFENLWESLIVKSITSFVIACSIFVVISIRNKYFTSIKSIMTVRKRI